MFYSHEILTNRKYGVATVWIVATLGGKSNTRKVTRKAILDVDVQKACETIMEPAAPMALRLQSNLLYGVSRVYAQQCDYVLADAQTIQNNLRMLIKITRHNHLDPDAGKARPEQIILGDDPAFLPDMALPALEFDFLNIDIGAGAGDSQRSMLSPNGRRASTASGRSGSVPGLNLPSSSNGGGSYQLPFDPFSGSSAQKQNGGTGRLFEDEEQVMFDDNLNLDFGIDADGNLLGFTDEELQQRREMQARHTIGSDSGASGRVRREHERALAGQSNARDEGGDFGMMQFGDDEMPLPDADAFPMMSGANPDAVRRDPLQQPSSPQLSSERAEAPQKRRTVKKPKVLAVDGQIEYNNSKLLEWQKGYLDNMEAETSAKEAHRKVTQSKKVAYNYVWGGGIGGVGYGIGSSKLESPLSMFAGEALMIRLTGKPDASAAKTVKGTKRPLEVEDEVKSDSNSETRRVRARQDEEAGRGMEFNDDGMMMGDDSTELEVGRDAPSALSDQLPSHMPWNMSASLHSHQRGHSQPSSSIHGPGSHYPGSLGRRLTAASPLRGRGSNVAGELEHFNQSQDVDLPIMYGRDDEDDDAVLRGKATSMSSSHAAADDFDIFGATAGVDTQTAGTSQWVREALDRESNNFFDYVKNSISEKLNDELEGGDDVFAAQNTDGNWVGFEELFEPETNSRMVAAQAFLHVLTLATKRQVWVEQDREEGEVYGEIRIGILS